MAYYLLTGLLYLAYVSLTSTKEEIQELINSTENCSLGKTVGYMVLFLIICFTVTTWPYSVYRNLTDP